MLFFVALGEVCWQCNCTKGSLDLGMAYTNVRADAPGDQLSSPHCRGLLSPRSAIAGASTYA